MLLVLGITFIPAAMFTLCERQSVRTRVFGERGWKPDNISSCSCDNKHLILLKLLLAEHSEMDEKISWYSVLIQRHLPRYLFHFFFVTIFPMCSFQSLILITIYESVWVLPLTISHSREKKKKKNNNRTGVLLPSSAYWETVSSPTLFGGTMKWNDGAAVYFGVLLVTPRESLVNKAWFFLCHLLVIGNS